MSGARFTAVLPADALGAVAPDAVKRLVAEADRLMAGQAEYFGVTRDDMAGPDWQFDPRTGRRAPLGYAFDVPYRDEDAVGDIKQIWEPSRHQYLTVLAAAYALTGDDRYAERVAAHLRSWWEANPPLRGVHWVSGIELGIRLVSWVWVRRLLDGWAGAPALFEENPVALDQIWHHQRWLAAFPSRGRRRTTTPSPRPPGSSPPPVRSTGSRTRPGGGRTRCATSTGTCAPTPSCRGSTVSWRASTTGWSWSWVWPRWPRRTRRAPGSRRRCGWCCCG